MHPDLMEAGTNGEQCSQEDAELLIRVNLENFARHCFEVASDEDKAILSSIDSNKNSEINTHGELKKMFVRIHAKQCCNLAKSLNKAWKDLHANTDSIALEEFRCASSEAEFLFEQCGKKEWLLKALELCSEHFVEVQLLVQWSSDVARLKTHNMQLGDIIAKQIEMLNCLRGQNVEESILDSREDDERSLLTMVSEVVEGTENDTECQLSNLFRNRQSPNALWHPRELENRVRQYQFPIVGWPVFEQRHTGGGAVVIKFDWVYGKTFALKIPHPAQDESKVLKRESKVLDRCRNPYIVGMFGFWELEIRDSWRRWKSEVSIATLMMEYLGCNLGELIAKAKKKGMMPLSTLEVINLMLPVAKAMRYLHSLPVAHRDLKPQNMCTLKRTDSFSCLQGIKVKVIDFGSAWGEKNVCKYCKYCKCFKYCNCPIEECPIGVCGVTGTTAYMAPELYSQNKPESVNLLKTDVFSFGMIIGELLTWNSPLDAFGCGVSDFKTKIVSGRRPSLPENCPSYVTFIVESCWSKYPVIRPRFEDICVMLDIAKLLLSGLKKFDSDVKSTFSYLDETVVERNLYSYEME